MNIKPFEDRVLVELVEKELKKTATGIILPEKEKEILHQGKIVELGEVAPELKKGDVIVFHWGDELRIGSDTYWLVKGENILAILK